MSFNRKSVEVTASTDSLVISVSDMAEFLRLDEGSGYTALVESYIKEATEAVKRHLRRGIQTETFTFRMDRFAETSGDEAMVAMGAGVHSMSRDYLFGGNEFIDLPFPPLQSITSITTYDSDDSSTVFSSANYGVDTKGGRVYLNESKSWPSDLRDFNAVEIVYVAGYGSGSVPEPILGAIRKYVIRAYDGCDGMSDEIIRALAPYRIMDQLAW
jgi:hypothetical protein